MLQSKTSLPAVARGILINHHAFLRAQLRRAAELDDRIVVEQQPPLCHRGPLLRRLFRHLRLELEAYFELEEVSLFPAMVSPATAHLLEDMAENIRLARHGQEAISAVLVEIREVTQGFRAPVDSCAAYIAWLDTLRAIDADLALEFRLENETLFSAEAVFGGLRCATASACASVALVGTD
jgi:regulator of cell morphogenesis and NO signaling